MTARTYTLLGPDRQPYPSATSGALGGYRPDRVYGRLDCPSALRAIARGGYVSNRVFFADEQTAVAAGYRPCAVCLPDEHAQWKAPRGHRRAKRGSSGCRSGVHLSPMRERSDASTSSPSGRTPRSIHATRSSNARSRVSPSKPQ